MPTCIFCRASGVSFATDEHVIPESLGGPNDALLPSGLVCDGCQQYFGSKIEGRALHEPPFSVLRAFIGVPTKKGKAPKINLGEQGVAFGHPAPGQFIYRPPVGGGVEISPDGRGQIRIPTDPDEPTVIGRFLVKIGLECIAAASVGVALSAQYDDARTFSRYAPPGKSWWYLLAEDGPSMVRWVTGGATDADKAGFISARPFATPEGAQLFTLRIAYAALTTPLHANISCAPPPAGMRLFRCGSRAA
jgi:hypothetical protein